ncbi:hypothetical protein CYMTET_8633 [Cymbomonas tetramitiformis]|uniref:Uncharacterized protein n=1 Tax=Cymbomonas tetramitiformis TaxID=36881 RepID=A0AAE0LFM9_9CHLO|nr:hypothetical protein CYMTET_8633 [Cymbomonas tetramitiformis]
MGRCRLRLTLCVPEVRLAALRYGWIAPSESPPDRGNRSSLLLTSESDSDLREDPRLPLCARFVLVDVDAAAGRLSSVAWTWVPWTGPGRGTALASTSCCSVAAARANVVVVAVEGATAVARTTEAAEGTTIAAVGIAAAAAGVVTAVARTTAVAATAVAVTVVVVVVVVVCVVVAAVGVSTADAASTAADVVGAGAADPGWADGVTAQRGTYCARPKADGVQAGSKAKDVPAQDGLSFAEQRRMVCGVAC